MEKPAVPERFSDDHFYAKEKLFSFVHSKFYIYGPDETTLRFFVKQKGFKLKEAITVYGEEEMETEHLKIQARNVLDFSGTYDVETPDGEQVGALRRKGAKSLFRDEWEILNPADQVLGTIQEDSTGLALLRRVFSTLIPQTYHVTVEGQTVGTLSQRFWPFSPRFDIDFSANEGHLDPRLAVATIVVLLAIEGRQED
jgi:uncharacterized protein YxjI